MRVVPLLSSLHAPWRWREASVVELVWQRNVLQPWIGAVEGGLEVHALHAPDATWMDAPEGLLVPALHTDFLVLPVPKLEDRLHASRFFRTLEGLLEAPRTHRVVLRPLPGAAEDLIQRLQDLQGHGVAFCWDPAQGAEALDLYDDRLACAVAAPHADLEPLARRGYRWNVALPAASPEGFRRDRATLHLPEPCLPLAPTLPEAPLRWGSAWGIIP